MQLCHIEGSGASIVWNHTLLSFLIQQLSSWIFSQNMYVFAAYITFSLGSFITEILFFHMWQKFLSHAEEEYFSQDLLRWKTKGCAKCMAYKTRGGADYQQIKFEINVSMQQRKCNSKPLANLTEVNRVYSSNIYRFKGLVLRGRKMVKDRSFLVVIYEYFY